MHCKKIFNLCLAFVLALCLVPMQNVFANTSSTTKDGVKIVVSTDKDSYKTGDTAEVNVDLTNTNAYPVFFEKVEPVLPASFSLENSTLPQKVTIAANESKSFKLKANITEEEKKDNEEQKVTEDKKDTQEQKVTEDKKDTQEQKVTEDKKDTQEQKVTEDKKDAQEQKVTEDKKDAQKQEDTEEQNTAQLPRYTTLPSCDSSSAMYKTGENDNTIALVSLSVLAVLSLISLVLLLKGKKNAKKMMFALLFAMFVLPMMGMANKSHAESSKPADEEGSVSTGLKLNGKDADLTLKFELYHPRVSNLEVSGDKTLKVDLKGLPTDWKGKVILKDVNTQKDDCMGEEVTSKDVKSSDTSISFEGLDLDKEYFVEVLNEDGTRSNTDMFKKCVCLSKKQIFEKFGTDNIKEYYIPEKLSDFAGEINYGAPQNTHSVVHAYYIDGVGHCSTWVMSGLMSVVILTPIEKNAPQFCDDRMDQGPAKILLLEMYQKPLKDKDGKNIKHSDPNSNSDVQALGDLAKKYIKQTGVTDMFANQTKEWHEYVDWLLPQSSLTMVADEKQRLAMEQEYVGKYLDLLVKSEKSTDGKQPQNMQDYVDMLLDDPGGPTVAVKNLLGGSDSLLRDFFEYYYMGSKKPA
jgi:hypothetical protein